MHASAMLQQPSEEQCLYGCPSPLYSEKSRKEFAKALWNETKNRRPIASDPCEAALKTFPDIVIKAWKEKGMRSKGLTSFQMFTSLWQIGKELREPNMAMFMVSGTVGVFSPELRLVRYQKDLRRSWLDYPFSWKDSVDVCGHEIAHFVEWVSRPSIPADKLFYLYSRESYLLDSYGSKNTTEFFADACWLSLRYPDITSKWMPETYEWFQSFFGLDKEKKHVEK